MTGFARESRLIPTQSRNTNPVLGVARMESSVPRGNQKASHSGAFGPGSALKNPGTIRPKG